jgi:hypothetical protein
MEALRERGGPERSEIERQLLSPRGNPSRMLAALAASARASLSSPYPDRGRRPRCRGREQQRNLAGPAADIEQAARTIETQLLFERCRDLRRVWEVGDGKANFALDHATTHAKVGDVAACVGKLSYALLSEARLSERGEGLQRKAPCGAGRTGREPSSSFSIYPSART